jgi:hypothetical protein
MAVNLSPVGGVAAQFFDNDGNVLSGGKIYTYLAGSSTNVATYTTSSGSIAHSNPIILDSAGRVPSGEIWLTDGISYKFVLNNSSNTLIGTYDNIVGINSNFVNFTNEQEIQTATASQTVFTLTTMQYQPGTGSLSVFVDGVNQYGPGAQYSYTETSSTVVTFNNGLHVGASVKFTTSAINASSYGDASQISYIPAGASAVATNVQAKLRETVSVQDFGAIGNGVADDTSAVQAAIASGLNVLFPIGTYLLSSPITLLEGQRIEGQSRYGSKLKFIGDINGVLLAPYSAIDNLRIIGTSSMAATKGCILFGQSLAQPSYRCAVTNCILGGLNVSLGDISNDKCGGAGILGGPESYLAVFENIYFFYSNVGYDNPQTGTQVNNALLFSGCEFKSCTIGARLVTLNGVNFNQCTFEANEQAGLIIGNSLASCLNGCYFEANNLGTGSAVKSDLFIGSLNTMVGVGVQTGKGISVKDTYFAAGTNSAYGIYVEGQTNVVVDNVFFGSYSTNYSVYIAGNVADTGVVANVYAASAAPVFTGTADFIAYNNQWTGSNTEGVMFAQNGFSTVSGVTFSSGAAAPNGNITAPPGSLYTKTAGGASATLWVKESGTGNTGWVAK